MATSSNRDVRLGIEITTAGEESVQKLAAAVRALGKEGDPAAAEFERLATELDRLGQQAGAIQSLAVLRTDVEQLSIAERETATAAAAATTAYKDQAAATAALREAQALARAEAAQAKTAYDDLKLAFQTLRNAGADAGQSQASFTAALAESRQQVDEQNRALKARRDELTASNTAVREATAAETALRKEFETTSRQATTTASALTAQKAALQGVEAAAISLGADVTDLAAAENALLEATRSYVNDVGIKRRQVALDQAEADRLAAIEARALAEAQQEAAAEAASELAAIKESAQFTQQYTAAKAAAAAATLKLAAAEEQRVAKLIEQNAADRDAFNAAQALADVRERGRVVAESELAAIRDSETFTRQYAAAQRDAATAADAVALANERASVAARAFADAEAAAAAQFEKMASQAAVANLFAQSLYEVEQAAAAAATKEKALADAAEAVSNAFGQTGVRSLQAIRSEMAGVTSSLGLLKQQFDVGAIGADDLARASSSAQVRLATLRQELQTIPALPNVFEKINSSINDLIGRFGSLAAAIATIGFVVKPVLDADVAFESLRRTLLVVTGSAEVAAQQIAFLRTTANLAGLSAGELAKSFTLFEASLLQSGASVKTTQTLFEGIAGAAGKLGLSTESVNGILVALGQVANKGKVQLEELQGQIGESLPGALKIAADSLGITAAQLTNLLKNGKLLSEDFLPAFGNQLVKTFGLGVTPVDGLAQAFNRLKNAATTTAQGLVDTSAYKGLVTILDSLARNFDTVVTGTVSLGKAFIAFKAIGIAQEFFGIKAAAEAAAVAKVADAEAANLETAAIARTSAAIEVETVALRANTVARVANTTSSGFATGALAATAVGFEKVGTAVVGVGSKVGSLLSVLGGPYAAALALTVTFSKQLGEGLAYVAAKATGVIGTLDANEAALKKNAEAEKALQVAAQARADVVSASFVKVQAGYDKELTAVENAVAVSEKLVKAKKEEGQVSTALAALSGSEAAAKTAAANAANGNAVAIATELAAKTKEVALLEEERVALVAAAGAQSTWSESRKAFFLSFDQDIAKKKADLEITKQQAAADVEAADKAFLAAQGYKQTAADIAPLKAEVEAATENVKALTKALADGFTTQDRVRAAAEELAVTQGLLKVAYENAVAAILRNTAAQKESLDLALQDISIQKLHIQTNLDIAAATGQYGDVLNSQIAIKQLDLDATNKKIAADVADAAGMRQRAALLQDQLKLGDAQYAQKQREIDSINNAAKAKENEGKLGAEASRAQEVALGILNGTLYKGVTGFGDLGKQVDATTASMLAHKVAMGETLTEAELLDAANVHLAGSFNSLADAAKSASTAVHSNVDSEGFNQNTAGQKIVGGQQAVIGDGQYFDTAQYQRDAAAVARSGGAMPPIQSYVKTSPVTVKPKGPNTSAGSTTADTGSSTVSVGSSNASAAPVDPGVAIKAAQAQQAAIDAAKVVADKAAADAAYAKANPYGQLVLQPDGSYAPAGSAGAAASSGSTATTGSTVTTGGSTYVVNVQINTGAATKISVASQADATALTSMLDALNTAYKAAGG